MSGILIIKIHKEASETQLERQHLPIIGAQEVAPRVEPAMRAYSAMKLVDLIVEVPTPAYT
jgi:hypothetical protein